MWINSKLALPFLMGSLILTGCDGFKANPGIPDTTFDLAKGLATTSVPLWTSQQFTTGNFTVSFYATPTSSFASGEDSILGLSNGVATAYTDMAAIVRFSTWSGGSIDARNGDVYAYTNSVPYTAGVSYLIEMDIDVTSHTYSVYVTPTGGAKTLLAQSFSFRTEQAGVTSLNYFSYYSDIGGVTISNINVDLTLVSSSSPTPTPTPIPTPIPTPTPTPKPTPTPTPKPTATPAPAPTPAPSPTPAGSWASLDGSTAAPAGSPQYPSLLSGYKVRPAWKVAGVDYHVGVPAGAVLQNPTTLSGISGVSVDSGSHHIVVTGANLNITNIDFAVDGGWQLIIEDGGDNLIVKNSNFADGSNVQPMMNQVANVQTTFINDTFNGNSQNDGYNNGIFNLSDYGGATIEYCLIENSASDDIDYGQVNTVKYNVFANNGQYPGAHPDWLQLGNTIGLQQIVEFNTFIQQAGSSQGIGLYSGTPGDYTLVSASVTNNTIVTAQGQPNYVFSTIFGAGSGCYQATGGGCGYITGTVTIEDNYIDPTGVNTAVFETKGTLPSGAAYIQKGNIDMINGADLD